MDIVVPAKPALFLDRDGVINVRPENDYVKHISDFQFIEGVIEGIALLKDFFSPVLVVTNQQGIGKGLMTVAGLEKIHEHMLEQISAGGGRIDKVYFCGDLDNTGSFYRKPAVGMGLQAKKDFPGIHFRKSVMVGDTITDMMFGKRLHMKTVLIDTHGNNARTFYKLIDQRFNSLREFAIHHVQCCK